MKSTLLFILILIFTSCGEPKDELRDQITDL